MGKRRDYPRVSADAFDARQLRPSRVHSAARLVLVEGLTAYQAAAAMGLQQSAVSRYLAILLRPACPGCGRPLLHT